jgi:membrane protein YqaA with SNARE-associated domain
MLDFLPQLDRYALTAGLPGLFSLSFIDSAGLPTGAAPDFLLMALAHIRPQLLGVMALVTACTLGSALGCLVLYGVGRKGGQLILGKFDEQRRAQVREYIDRYGLWAVIAAVMGPPPIPTKLFILSAGVFGMRVSELLIGVLVGRAIRYGGAAYLGIAIGDHAVEILRGLL